MVDSDAAHIEWRGSDVVGEIYTNDNEGEHLCLVEVHKSPKGVVYLSITTGPEMLAVILDSGQASVLGHMLVKAFMHGD
jgi:hypothetical protein